jgi:hypothetical protein
MNLWRDPEFRRGLKIGFIGGSVVIWAVTLAFIALS